MPMVAEPTGPFSQPPAPAEPLDLLDLVRQAFELANAAAITDIESESHALRLDGRLWWDTRPMVDAARHGPELMSLMRASLRYALAAQLAAPHPERPYLVQILNRG